MPPPDHSIENRPEIINERKEVGHWEIDLVVGGKKKGAVVLLTLTERKTRKELIRKLKDRSQASVIRALNGMERQTRDNGLTLLYLHDLRMKSPYRFLGGLRI